jgi:pimeloyl-ACP methyl ester carboxylesterase
VRVSNEGVEIATTDHGGEGPALLLTHGAGTTQGSLARLVPELTGSFRVITFDMRSHGESSRAEFSWDAVAEDVEAVRAAYDIERAVVAGHSLGGMVAAMYAVAHPDRVSHAVNIDGHGQGRPEQYDGMTADEVAAAWARLDEVQGDFMPEMEPEVRAGYDRMIDVLKAIDLFDLYRRVPVPLLVFNAYGHDQLADLEGMAWYGDVMAAYRRGLGRDLDALATEHPSIEIAHLEAAHFLVVTHPKEVAERIIQFSRN